MLISFTHFVFIPSFLCCVFWFSSTGQFAWNPEKMETNSTVLNSSTYLGHLRCDFMRRVSRSVNLLYFPRNFIRFLYTTVIKLYRSFYEIGFLNSFVFNRFFSKFEIRIFSFRVPAIESEPEPPGEPPRFLKPIAGLDLHEGSPAKFEAVVTGKPEPVIQWLREGEVIQPSTDFMVRFMTFDWLFDRPLSSL